MADKKNLCAQIDIALHNRVTEEKDRLEMTTSQYIAALLTEYYKMKDENGGINMTGSRTMAFQIPEELFQRIKTHLARETARTGLKLTQRDFVLGLIEGRWQKPRPAWSHRRPRRAPRKPRRTTEPPVPLQTPARPARRRRETQQTSNNKAGNLVDTIRSDSRGLAVSKLCPSPAIPSERSRLRPITA